MVAEGHNPRFGRSKLWLPNLPSPDARREIVGAILDGAFATRRFYVLLALATTIAAFGLLSNSAAVIIGAMIVAPLMGPILGLSLGMVMGRHSLERGGVDRRGDGHRDGGGAGLPRGSYSVEPWTQRGDAGANRAQRLRPLHRVRLRARRGVRLGKPQGELGDRGRGDLRRPRPAARHLLGCFGDGTSARGGGRVPALRGEFLLHPTRGRPRLRAVRICPLGVASSGRVALCGAIPSRHGRARPHGVVHDGNVDGPRAGPQHGGERSQGAERGDRPPLGRAAREHPSPRGAGGPDPHRGERAHAAGVPALAGGGDREGAPRVGAAGGQVGPTLGRVPGHRRSRTGLSDRPRAGTVAKSQRRRRVPRPRDGYPQGAPARGRRRGTRRTRPAR